jgi:general secretion pathway protein J
MRKAVLKNAGFTLAELLAASTIGAFVAMVAVGTLQTISSSARRVSSITETADEVRFAARLISQDLTNLYRNSNIENVKFVCTYEQSAQGDLLPVLTFYTVCRGKARADQPEADVYEVSYFLVHSENKSVLFRRLWPYPDPNTEPGGIVMAIAENVAAFSLRFFDGTEWSTEWPETMETLPVLVEVTIAGQAPDRTMPVIESFVANFVRFQSPTSSTTTTATEGEQSTQTQAGQTGTNTSSQTGQTSTQTGTSGTSSGGGGSTGGGGGSGGGGR